MAKIDMSKQVEVLSHIKATFQSYKSLSGSYRDKMLDIYENYSTFKQEKQAAWQTTFKVNKAHEVIEKVLPRIMANNPRWIVSPRTDEFTQEDKFLTGEAKLERMKKINQMSRGIQDYLTYIFDNYNLIEPIRVWAKNMLVYGTAFAGVKFKYEMARIREEEIIGDETKVSISEKVIGEYPTIDVKSWTNIYVDPRYQRLSDMPAIIEVVDGVRLGDLKRKKEYFNLDKIEDMPGLEAFEGDPEGFRNRVFEITGISNTDSVGGIDKNALSMKIFYGLYSIEDNTEEKLYKITTIDDLFVIGFEEISQIPLQDTICFDDPEVYYGKGLVEPIIGLQQELNFKKNSASEYVNQSLNRSWIWSPNSGVNPKSLVSKPGNIIVTSKDGATAMNNLVELPFRNLPNDYFSEQNDFERQIQAMTFTVDTANPRSQTALTNTATGARIKFFEGNSVIAEIRKHLEKSIELLAYKLLQETFENMDDNIVIKKTGDEGFWELNKELMRDALTKYSIKMEAGSSSYDSVESRRDDALAFYNILLGAKAAGENVNLREGLIEVLKTFEKKQPEQFLGAPQPTMQQGGQPLEGGQTQQPGQGVAQLTQQVAKGDLTA